MKNANAEIFFFLWDHNSNHDLLDVVCSVDDEDRCEHRLLRYFLTARITSEGSAPVLWLIVLCCVLYDSNNRRN